MSDRLTQLQAMPNRELDAVLAECVYGCKTAPFGPELGLHTRMFPGRRGQPNEIVPEFCSPDSPRSLLDGVEMEIARRRLQGKYGSAVERIVGADGDFGLYFLILTAPARVRVIAAVMALEGVERG